MSCLGHMWRPIAEGIPLEMHFLARGIAHGSRDNLVNFWRPKLDDTCPDKNIFQRNKQAVAEAILEKTYLVIKESEMEKPPVADQ